MSTRKRKAENTTNTTTHKKNAANELYTVEQFVSAIRETKGMKTLAARRIGCEYKTFQRYESLYPEIAEAIQQERENMLDTVELKLYNRCMNDDITAIIFMLKTLGKQRGYIEKQVNVNVDMSKLSDDELRAIIEG